MLFIIMLHIGAASIGLPAPLQTTTSRDIWVLIVESFSIIGVNCFALISGYFGCDAINESSEEGNIIHTGQSIHYSGLLFHDTQMKPGNETLHNTGGMIRVTVLFPNETCKTSVSIRFTYLFYLITLTQ